MNTGKIGDWLTIATNIGVRVKTGLVFTLTPNLADPKPRHKYLQVGERCIRPDGISQL